jgi:TRAP transporter 4TM/12TM fusion protein
VNDRHPPWYQALATALALFVVAEVNYPHLQPQSQLAIFAGLGFILCFGAIPAHPSLAKSRPARATDAVLALLSAACCLYVVVQTEPAFEGLWAGGRPLGERAGGETTLDLVVGGIGLLLVLEGARRSLGPALSIVALAFVVYAYAGPHLPGWLFPHRGYDTPRIISQAFLQGQGVFGIALRVMFSYVYLFVVFGAFLEMTGATRFLVASARRLFSPSRGGPAKVAVASSGLLGSLSGSAVANAAATGTFTIPLMRSAGFSSRAAAGVTAAASSGGALVPPVMGAGAYMMLEIVDPPVTYLEIVRAALLPAILYYASLLLLVHFDARRVGAPVAGSSEDETPGGERAGASPSRSDQGGEVSPWAGVVFAVALGTLVALLILGYTVFRAVTLALVVLLVAAALRRETRVSPGRFPTAFTRAAAGGVPLITAAACIGIVIGIVVLTGIGTRLPGLILPLAEHNLLLALFVIMVSSIVLGMGLPSAVCYLLLATLIGPVLGHLGVVPLAAHFFIFYFGMMSMVTPPVALAAYTAASIAGTGALGASWSAFRYALVGFTLPYMFVFRPELLLVSPEDAPLAVGRVLSALVAAVLGITALAAALAGQLRHTLGPLARAAAGVAAALLLYPGLLPWRPLPGVSVLDVAGALLLAAVAFVPRVRPDAVPAA